MIKTVLFLLFLTYSTLINSQNLPAWVNNVYYIDVESEVSGDGSLDNPYNKWEDLPGYRENWSIQYPRNNTVWDNNMAVLFKNGTFLGSESNPYPGNISFSGDSIFIGNYGDGAVPRFTFGTNNPAITFIGNYFYIKGIEIGNLHENNRALNFLGKSETSRTGVVTVDSVIVFAAERGIGGYNHRRFNVINSVIHNTWDDGIYITEADTVYINGIHVHNVNKNYIEDPTNSSGGDCIQTEKSSVIIVENSILDHSKHGMKFNLITNDNDTTIVRNTVFVMHPHANTGIYATRLFVEASTFIGGHIAIWSTTHGPFALRVYNSLFIGPGKNFIYNDQPTGLAIMGSVVDVYNNTFVDYNTAIRGGNYRVNSRNNIFYNITSPYDISILDVSGSGNIHYNADGSSQENLNAYIHNDSFINADPLFVDYSNQDFRLSQGSPAINNADIRVFEGNELFETGQNINQTWTYWERGFTDYYTITTDHHGVARPHEGGYDIGAFEYREVSFIPEVGSSGKGDFILFPNPAKDHINIRLPVVYPSENILISIFDMTGKLIYKRSWPRGEGNNITINLNNFPAGLYLLRISYPNMPSVTKKLLIQG